MTENVAEDRGEALRHEWRERFHKLVEELAGPAEFAASLLGAETRAQAILRAAHDIETARLHVQHPGAEQAPRRRDPLWGYRKWMGGR